MKQRYIWVLLLCGLFVTYGARPSMAADLIDEDDVNVQKIKELFDAAFIKCEIDKDGDLLVVDEGMKIFLRIDKKRNLITFFSAWGLKSSVSELKKLQLVNKLNDDLIIVRFAMKTPMTLWCDYQFLYDGGVTPFTIVNNYKVYVRVTKGAVASQDPDDIIGSD